MITIRVRPGGPRRNANLISGYDTTTKVIPELRAKILDFVPLPHLVDEPNEQLPSKPDCSECYNGYNEPLLDASKLCFVVQNSSSDEVDLVLEKLALLKK